jgi:hypothetical protein
LQALHCRLHLIAPMRHEHHSNPRWTNCISYGKVPPCPLLSASVFEGRSMYTGRQRGVNTAVRFMVVRPFRMSWEQVFDRGSFGVGSLTTNRYQPPEKVGDPLPSRAPPPSQQPQAGGSLQQLAAAPGSAAPSTSLAGAGSTSSGTANGVSTGSSMRYSGRAAAAASGRLNGAASSASLGGSKGATQTFMPFAMPTYSIPITNGRAKVRVCCGEKVLRRSNHFH